MKYRSIDRPLTKRLSIYGGLWSNMNVPTVSVGYDEGAEYIAFAYGNEGADPVFGISLDLAGTRVGRLVCDVGWRFYRWRHRDRSQTYVSATSQPAAPLSADNAQQQSSSTDPTGGRR